MSERQSKSRWKHLSDNLRVKALRIVNLNADKTAIHCISSNPIQTRHYSMPMNAAETESVTRTNETRGAINREFPTRSAAIVFEDQFQETRESRGTESYTSDSASIGFSCSRSSVYVAESSTFISGICGLTCREKAEKGDSVTGSKTRVILFALSSKASFSLSLFLSRLNFLRRNQR